MLVRLVASVLALSVGTLYALPSQPASAQDAEYVQGAALGEDVTFSKAELDQILAPIALYPDDVLANVLMASTYPLGVVEAARWLEQSDNAELKGEALLRALDDKDWDPSVKALTTFPDVLGMMSENLDWTRKLGDAVLADQAAVMDRVQFLRDKADTAGNLDSNEHQKVSRRREDGDEYIYIEPADPEVIYVPVYEPTVVYGDWWYPDYPPYYWPLADDIYYDTYYWGIGVAIAPALWDWSRPRWHRHYIHIDPRKYNRLRHRKHKRFRSNRWRHDRHHRRGVRYDRKRDRAATHDRRDSKKKRLRLKRKRDFVRGNADGKRRRTFDRRKVDKHGKPHRNAGDRKRDIRKRLDRARDFKKRKKGPPKKRAFSGSKKRPDAKKKSIKKKSFNKKGLKKSKAIKKGSFKKKKSRKGKSIKKGKSKKSFKKSSKSRKSVKTRSAKKRKSAKKSRSAKSRKFKGKRKSGKRRSGKRGGKKRGGGKGKKRKN